MYDIILFDLDGTLTESGPGIVNSAIFALKSFGIEETDRESLLRFVGPPLKDSFMEFYGFSSEKADEAVVEFRKYFREKGMFENSPYPGIPELLQRLKADGRVLAVATSKVEDLAVQILEHFDLMKYFDYVIGSGYDGSLGTKSEVIAETLKRCRRDSRFGRVAMVGDRHHDIEGALANNIDSIGVLYGYGTRSELEDAGALFVAERVADIYDCVSEYSG